MKKRRLQPAEAATASAETDRKDKKPVRGEYGLQFLTDALQSIPLEDEPQVRDLLKRLSLIFSVPVPSLEFSTRGQIFGRYHYDKHRIVIGARGRDVATVLHEFAHHVVTVRAGGTRQPHGKEFKEVLRELCWMAYGIYSLPLPAEAIDFSIDKHPSEKHRCKAGAPELGELVVVDGKRFGRFQALVLRPKRTRAFVKRIVDGSLFDVPFALIERKSAGVKAKQKKGMKD